MRILNNPNINFIENRNIGFIISGVLILATLVSLIAKGGPSFSIDFAGGNILQIVFNEGVEYSRNEIQKKLSSLELGNPLVKRIGKPEEREIQITIKSIDDAKLTETSDIKGSESGDAIKAAIKELYGEDSFEVRREEKVGPKIGGELKNKAFLAILFSLIAIVIYIGIRFHFPFGIAAIAALFHDVLITIGVFSVFNLEISLPIIAALLTIVGYSLNDTIVIFDRIRENMKSGTSKKSFPEKVNLSINQCLSRTVITSFTTLFVVLSIFFFFIDTGNVLEYFSIALLSGVIAGTYSSVFTASPVLVLWDKKWPIK